jgi:hypothetical protein
MGPERRVMLARTMLETKSRRIEQGEGPLSTVQCHDVAGFCHIEPHHVAEYVSEMLTELRNLSATANLPVLACLIEAARLEAEDQSQL